MKFTKEYFFGGNKRRDDGYVTDYVSAYIAENGKRINVVYHTETSKWYEVDGIPFDTLKEAKAAC